MREIKFRAWYKDGDVGKMYDVTNVQFSLNRENDFGFLALSHGLSMPSADIMQYTGINDDSDNEIYEGDILFDGTDYYEVKFDKGMFTYENGHSNKLNKHALVMMKQLMIEVWQVVGNIYENPELLEVQE